MGEERAGFEVGYGECSAVGGGGGSVVGGGGGGVWDVGMEEGGEGVEREGGVVGAVEGVVVEVED